MSPQPVAGRVDAEQATPGVVLHSHTAAQKEQADAVETENERATGEESGRLNKRK